MDNQFDYMMLARYQADLKYFFGYGGRHEGHLHFHNFKEHLAETVKLWESLKDKPEWFAREELDNYEVLYNTPAPATDAEREFLDFQNRHLNKVNTMSNKQHRVWIEIERETDSPDYAAINTKRAELLTNLLDRLKEPEHTSNKVVWGGDDSGYFELHEGQAGSYHKLGGDGEWFNLEYYGRELEPVKPKTNTLKQQPMFATPDDQEAMMQYIEKFNGGEKVAAMTCAMMMWNLCAKLTNPEPKPIDPAIMDEYERLTDINNHNDALLVLAKACGLVEVVPTIEEIERQLIQDGGLSESLYKLRHKIHRQLIDRCNEVFTDFPYE